MWSGYIIILLEACELLKILLLKLRLNEQLNPLLNDIDFYQLGW